MASSTPNFGFALPDVGGDTSTWGSLENQNWSSLDSILENIQSLYRGAWSATTGYLAGNIVQYSGNFYMTNAASTNQVPTAGSPWYPFGATGATGAVGPTGATGQVSTAQLNAAINTLVSQLGATAPNMTYGLNAAMSPFNLNLGNIYANTQAVSASGTITSVSVNSSTSGGNFQVIVFTLSGSTATTVSLTSLPIAATGKSTIAASIPVTAGQYVGVIPANNANITYSNVSATILYGGFGNSSIGGTNTVNSTGFAQLDFSYTVAPSAPETISQVVQSGGVINTAITALVNQLNSQQPTLSYGRTDLTTSASTYNGFIGTGVPAAYGGTITAVSIRAASSGGNFTLVVYSKSGTSITILQAATVPCSGTGVVNYAAGTDFAALPIAAGQYFGVVGSNSSQLIYAPSSVGFIYGGSGSFSVGSTVTGVSTNSGGQPDISFVVTAATGTSQSIATVATAAAIQNNHWYGSRVGVWGNSYTSDYLMLWLSTVLAENGLTLAFVDSHHGRALDAMFEYYNVSSSNPTPVSTLVGASPATMVRGTGNQQIAFSYIYGTGIGNTLAQDLANVDLLLIELLTNTPANAFGSPTDSESTNSACGNIKFVLDAIYAAKPTIRVGWMSPLQLNPAISGMASQTQFLQLNGLLKASALYYSTPVLDLGSKFPCNPNTWATLTRDGAHLTDAAYGDYGKLLSGEVARIR